MTRRSNTKGQNDTPGGFAGIPRIVMEHSDYIGLSFPAKALLIELAYQYRGHNNGDLTVGFAVMKGRGWKRDATVQKMIAELIRANLIVRTRESRFTNPGARCALYALTWQAVDECKGKDLEIPPSITPLRKFSLENKKINKAPTTPNVHGGYTKRNHE